MRSRTMLLAATFAVALPIARAHGCDVAKAQRAIDGCNQAFPDETSWYDMSLRGWCYVASGAGCVLI